MVKWIMKKYIKSFLIILCHQQLLINLLALNVALKKYAKDCNNRNLGNAILDGIKNPQMSAEVENQCEGKKSFVEVMLMGGYVIHYVIVYAGENIKAGQLDYFKVDIENGEMRWIPCSNFPEPAFPGSGMRVNCDQYRSLHTGIRVQSRTDHGLSISEIEVHTLTMKSSGDRLNIFRGCYKKFGHESTVFYRVVEPVLYNCQHFCLNKHTVFYSIKGNAACSCEDDYDENEEVSPEICNMKCEDGVNSCGGNDAYSVYLALIKLPKYHGCLEAVRPLEDTLHGGMTIEKCLRHCHNKSYALLQDGDICFCQQIYPGKNDSLYDQCTSRCTGDSNAFCGGHGFTSVYETCIKTASPSVSCSTLLKCDDYNKYGVCKSKCKPGFYGEYCIEKESRKARPVRFLTPKIFTTKFAVFTTPKPLWTTRKGVPPTPKPFWTPSIADTTSTTKIPFTILRYTTSTTKIPFTILRLPPTPKPLWTTRKAGPDEISSKPIKSSHFCNNDDTCKGKTNTECVVYSGKEICQCILGYQKFDKTGSCKDIDECEFEPCDTHFSYCVNVNGSYFCECKIGYRRITEDHCLYNETLPVNTDNDLLNYFISSTILYPMVSLLLLVALMWLSIPTHSSEVDIQRSSFGEDFRGASTYSGAPDVSNISPDNDT